MSHIDKNVIINKLIKQGYPDKVAEIVSSELVSVDCVLKPLIEKWMEGDEPDYESNGYSILGLMKTRKMTYPAALLTIDWLIKDPEAAKKSLARGVK